MLVGQTNVSKRGSFHEIYVLDAVSGIIRNPKFRFKDLSNGINFVHFLLLGDYSMFFSSHFVNKESKSSNIYIVNNKKEELVLISSWHASNLTHFYTPGSDLTTYVEAKHDNGDVKKVKVATRKLITANYMFLHLLLHLNEDFDDDLLQDTLEALDCL